MSLPFWIFIAALGAICVWALISKSLFARRGAKHAAEERALSARLTEFRSRVDQRNARIQAEASTADSDEQIDKAIGSLYLDKVSLNKPLGENLMMTGVRPRLTEILSAMTERHFYGGDEYPFTTPGGTRFRIARFVDDGSFVETMRTSEPPRSMQPPKPRSRTKAQPGKDRA